MDFRIRREDLPLIRLPLALFGAALLLALALVLLAVWQQGKAERQRQNGRTGEREARHHRSCSILAAALCPRP